MAIGSTVATALNFDIGSPIFLVERTSYSLGHRPVDYGKLHGDQIRFVTRLARRSPGELKGGSPQ
jgi:GntR family transcriptional regulator